MGYGGSPPFRPSDIPPDGMCVWSPYAGLACARGAPANTLATQVGEGAKWQWVAGALWLTAGAIVAWPDRKSKRRR